MRACSRFALTLRRGRAYLPAPYVWPLYHSFSFSTRVPTVVNEVPPQPPSDRSLHTVEQAVSCITSRGVNSFEALTHYIKIFGKRGRVETIQALLDSVASSAVSRGPPSEAPTLSLNHYHCNAAMAAYVSNNRAQLALEIFASMEQRWGVVPDDYSYKYAMLAFERLGRWEDALALFRRMGVLGLPRKPAVCVILIRCLGSAGKVEEAWQLYSTEMGDVGRIFVEKEIVRILCSAGRWRDALELLDRPGPSTASAESMQVVLDALRAQGESELLLEVQAKWADALKNRSAVEGDTRRVGLLDAEEARGATGESENSPHSHSTSTSTSAGTGTGTCTGTGMHAVMAEAVRTGQYHAAVAAADAYVASGRWKDSILCVCFKLFGLALLPERVQSLIEQMDRQGVPLNIFHCNAAMTAFIRCDRPEIALVLFDLMEQRWRVNKDEFSYGCAMLAFERLGRWEDALALYKSLDSAGIKRTDSVICASVITTLGNAGQWRQAYSLFGDLGGHTSNFTKSAILSALRSAGQLQLMESLRLEFESQENQSGYKPAPVGPGMFDFREIRRKARVSGDYSSALASVDEYLEKCALTRGAITECFRTLGDAQSPQRLLGLVQHLEARGVALNLYHCNAAMAAFNNCGGAHAKHAVALFQTMERRWGVKKNEFSYGAAMQAYFQVGHLEQCVQLLNEAKRLGLPTNEVMYTIAIKARGKAGKWQDALALFREMGDAANEHAKASLLQALKGRAPASVVETLENQFRSEKVGISKEEERRIFF
jgi:pentatricopeptide repeat protein